MIDSTGKLTYIKNKLNLNPKIKPFKLLLRGKAYRSNKVSSNHNK